MTSDNPRQQEVRAPGISAAAGEPRGWGCRGGLESLRLGTLDEKYYMKYTSNTVNYRMCVITLSKGL